MAETRRARSRDDMMIALRLGRSKPFLRATTASSVRGHFYAIRALANLMHPVGAPARQSPGCRQGFHGAAEDLIELMQGR